MLLVRQELVNLCKKSTKKSGNCFIIFVGISFSWVVFFISSRFISFEISSTVTHVKEKLATFSKRDEILLTVKILQCFRDFLISFSTGSQMLENC